MSRRALLSLVASVIIGIGFVATVSTDASAYRAGVYRGGVYRGDIYRGGIYRGGIYRGVRPGVAVGIGAAAAGTYYRPGYYAPSYYAPSYYALGYYEPGYYGAPVLASYPYGYYYYALSVPCVLGP